MSHEKTDTIKNPKGDGWINRRTVNTDEPMTPEQKRFFSKVFDTEDKAVTATKNRSHRYRVRDSQRIKKFNKGGSVSQKRKNSKNPKGVANGCGMIMESKRKKTKYA